MKIEFFSVKLLSLLVLVLARPEWNSQNEYNSLGNDWGPAKNRSRSIKIESIDYVYDKITEQMKHSSNEEKQSMIQTLQDIYEKLPTFPSNTMQIYIKEARHRMNVGWPGSSQRIRAVNSTKTLMGRISEWISWIVNNIKFYVLGYPIPTTHIKEKDSATLSATGTSTEHTHTTDTPTSSQGQNLRHGAAEDNDSDESDDESEGPSGLKPGSMEAKLHYIRGYNKDWLFTSKSNAINEIKKLIPRADDKLKETLRKVVKTIKDDKPKGADLYQEIIVKELGHDPFPE